MAELDFKNMFQAFSDTEEKQWKYDRNASLGASAAFDCIRKAFFDKWGYEPDDDHEQDWGAAKRGDLIENYFAVPATKAILPETAQLLYAGEEQDTLKSGRLTATPDGLAIGLDKDALKQLGIDDIESDCVVIEYKSFDPRAHIVEEKAIHSGQTQVQMGLFHEKTDYKPMYAVIIYFNASWFSDIRPFVVKYDPKIYAAAKTRAASVFVKDAQPADFMAEGKLSGACNLCQYKEECAIATGEATPKIKKKIDDVEVQDRLAVLAKRRSEHAEAQKEAEKEKKICEEEIKEILRKHDTKGDGNDIYNISLSWCAGKKSLDTTLLAADLEADGKSIDDYQKIGNGYERLTVKVK